MTVTGSVSISGTPSVTISGTPSVNITGTANINIYGQSVAIKTQGEWAPQVGQAKHQSTPSSGTFISANASASILTYQVPIGKTFYITHTSFLVTDMATGTGDGLPVGMTLWDFNPSTGTSTALVHLGGNGGGCISFPTPIPVVSQHIIVMDGYNSCERTLTFYGSFGGYEL
jgi:hypothetical protein